MTHALPSADQITAEIFKVLDSNRDGLISFTEIQGVLDAHGRENAANAPGLQRLFNAVDVNHDGSLSVGEVKAAASLALTALHHHPGLAQELLARFTASTHHDGWVV